MRQSVEQMCRDLLDEAVSLGLVATAKDEWDDPHPQARSSGELTGMANMLCDMLRKLTNGE